MAAVLARGAPRTHETVLVAVHKHTGGWANARMFVLRHRPQALCASPTSVARSSTSCRTCPNTYVPCAPSSHSTVDVARHVLRRQCARHPSREPRPLRQCRPARPPQVAAAVLRGQQQQRAWPRRRPLSGAPNQSDTRAAQSQTAQPSRARAVVTTSEPTRWKRWRLKK